MRNWHGRRWNAGGRGCAQIYFPPRARKLGSQGSNNAQYLLRRIKRESPEILQRYEAGEFQNVKAAAREAGIVKEPTAFETARKAIVKALPHLTPEERHKLKELLQ
jgi:hypothetical protein